MASWIWGSSTNPQIEELIEKACSPLNLPWPESEDIALNLEICDMIRSKTIPPRAAMQSLKSRIANKNGRVQMSALGLTDTCIKNGGDHFLQEVAGKEFVGEMMGVIRAPATNPQVRKMALELFQQWAISFETKSSLSYLPEMYRELKASGVSFPSAPTNVASHLLTTATPPSWVDSDSCMRCRSAFTFTNRKHHCRNCGLVFDQACSSKAMKLPDLGILEEVRVCEPCYAKAGKGRLSKNDPSTPAVPAKRSVRADQFDADLQRAISLSLAEGNHNSFVAGSQPVINGRQLEGTDDVPLEDEEFRLAIEASLAEMKQVRPSAPGVPDETELKPLPTYDLSTRETETLLTFAQTVDHAVGFGDNNLVKFPHARGLHDQAAVLADKLHKNLDEKGTKYRVLADMHNQLMQSVRTYDRLQREKDQKQQYLTQQHPYAVPLPLDLGYSQPDLATPAPWSNQDVPSSARFDPYRDNDFHNMAIPSTQDSFMPNGLPYTTPLYNGFSGRDRDFSTPRPTVSAYPNEAYPSHLYPDANRNRQQDVSDPALQILSLPSAPTHDVSTLTHEMRVPQTKSYPKEELLIEL